MKYKQDKKKEEKQIQIQEYENKRIRRNSANRQYTFEMQRYKAISNNRNRQSKQVCIAKVYKVLNSNITKEFMIGMKEKVPFNIKAIQTDNGLECKNILINIHKIKNNPLF